MVHCTEKDTDLLEKAHTQRKGICEQFEVMCGEYSIKDKLDYIISDNATNLQKAFIVGKKMKHMTRIILMTQSCGMTQE